MHDTLSSFLLNLSARSHATGLGRQTVRLRVRRQDLADYLGLSLAELEAEFERLSAAGMIRRTSGEFLTIVDRTALWHDRGGARPKKRAS